MCLIPPHLKTPWSSPSKVLLYNLSLGWKVQLSGNRELDLWIDHCIRASIFPSTCRGMRCLDFLNLWWSLHCGLIGFSIFPTVSLFHICISINSVATHSFAFQLSKACSYPLLYYSLYPLGLCLCWKNPFTIIFSEVSEHSRNSCVYSICHHSWQCCLS